MQELCSCSGCARVWTRPRDKRSCGVDASRRLVHATRRHRNSIMDKGGRLADHGRLAQMVERSLSMREAPGSMPGSSTFLFLIMS